MTDMIATLGGMNQHTSKSVGFDETNKSSSYLEYPSVQPFINDDYRLPESKRFKAFPESNRQAVMSALRGLQEKFRQLELERANAESNLRTFTGTHASRNGGVNGNGVNGDGVNGGGVNSEVTRDTDTDGESSSVVSAARDANVSAHARDIHEKLTAAESRCELLERQLGCMRRMVQHGATRWRHADDSAAETTRSQLDKISELERVHLRLSATQAIAENKIRELEDELKQEKHCRHMMQQQQSKQEARQVLLQSIDSQPRRSAKKTKKKRAAAATTTTTTPAAKTTTTRRPVTAQRVNSAATKWTRTEPTEHYHLNLAGIPFIAGKSTTPSHSLAANFQEVLSLMKCHNARLCRSPHSATANTPRTTSRSQSNRGRHTARIDNSNDLDQLLLQLEDEFGRLSFEHLELKRQQQETRDPGLRDDLEREHDRLLAAMEAKASQIAQLQRHREAQLRKKKTKKRPEPEESEDTVTKDTTTTKVTAHSAGRGRASLNLLKDLKKIQTTLRKDDLSWDE